MKSLIYLNKYFYKYRFRLGLGVVFVAISNLFGIVPAQLIRHALDQSGQMIEYFHELSWFEYASVFRSLISFNLLIFVGFKVRNPLLIKLLISIGEVIRANYPSWFSLELQVLNLTN